MSNIGVELTDVHAQTITIRGVKVGFTIEELVATLEAKGLLVASELAGLQRRTIIALARRLKTDVLDFRQAVTELERAVEIALDVIARGERGTNDDAFVNTVLARVAEKVRNDDFDGGASAIDEALAELEAGYKRSQVTLLEEGVKIDTLRRDAVAVTQRIEMIVAADHPTDRPAWLPEFRARYDEFEADGTGKGINFSLSVAIELARRMAATARDANERGIALNLLGNALLTLGDRESGTARLKDAVAAFRAAQEAWTRGREPLDWARTQTNLGRVLRSLGERKVGTEQLEKAVGAIRAAQKILTREREPLDWARAQYNLGNAFRSLGEREMGTARLEEAVATYRAAQQVWTREGAPLDWARAQVNLGLALTTVGEREMGTTRLEEAVATYRAALEVRTRARVPLDWARTQNHLGRALVMLGEREVGTARLKEAVSAFRQALQERTRERVPLQWATTQDNLGLALQTLGQRESGTARLKEAVNAFRDALQERTRERVPLQWATTQNNLGAALTALGEREIGTARLEEAVAAFDACLTVTEALWPEERTQRVRSHRGQIQSIITRRPATK